MLKRTLLASAISGLAVVGGTNAALALDEITVAYFLEWPMPFNYAKAQGTYEKELGLKINWRSFDTGTAMSAAMASGDVQLAFSQGIPPFVTAVSAGQDLQALDVAVSYSDNDNCVVRADLEITKENAGELAGKRVALPVGTTAHYGFLRQMEHFGVDTTTMQIVDMAPADGAAAIAQSSIDMACGFGGGLRRMQEYGNVLLTGAEKEELGILVFDVTSGSAEFVAQNPDLTAKFLAVTAAANTMWADSANHAEMLPIIAKDSGMDEASASASLATFSFPTMEQQLSAKWLDGGIATYMKGVADVFAAAGGIPATLDSYEGAINSGPMKAASGM